MTSFIRTIAGQRICVETYRFMRFDEMVALWLAERYATEYFVKQYCSDGVLRLGVGGGVFDSRTLNPGEPRRSDDACAIRVVRALSHYKNPLLKRVLEFVQVRNRGEGDAFDVAALVDIAHVRGDPLLQIMVWANIAIEQAVVDAKAQDPRLAVVLPWRVRGEDLSVTFPSGVDILGIAILMLLENYGDRSFVTNLRSSGSLVSSLSTLDPIIESLGLKDRKECWQLLSFLRRDPPALFDLKQVVAALTAAQLAPELIVDWGLRGLRLKHWDQHEFFVGAHEEFLKRALIESVRVKKRRSISVASIESDHPLIARYARSESGSKVDVIIQKRTNGNVIILARRGSNANLARVAYLLSLAEQRCAGTIITEEWPVLTREGLLPDGRWYYQYRPQGLMNGTLSFEVPPTSIEFSEIVRLVKVGLMPLHSSS